MVPTRFSLDRFHCMLFSSC